MNGLEIIGNIEARQFLDRAVRQGQLAPSYLFVGTRGLGKALTARWLAQRVFCRNQQEAPCGECSACQRVARNNHPDFSYVERLVKKESGGPGIVEQVRHLIAEVQTSPYEADTRFFAFNEAGALNDQSQNCLLKTVEEPPPHLVLILITESLCKILTTIVSRCCVVRFSEMDRGELAWELMQRGCEEERAQVLAAISGGVPGKALQLMEDDKAWDFRQQVLQSVQDLMGADIWTALETARILEDLVPRKESSAEKKRVEVSSFSPGFEGMLGVLTSYYRDAMVLAAGGDPALIINSDVYPALVELAQNRGARELEDCLTKLAEAEKHLGSHVQSRLWLQHLCLGLASAN